jgi:hypothetical protein
MENEIKKIIVSKMKMTIHVSNIKTGKWNGTGKHLIIIQIDVDEIILQLSAVDWLALLQSDYTVMLFTNALNFMLRNTSFVWQATSQRQLMFTRCPNRINACTTRPSVAIAGRL